MAKGKGDAGLSVAIAAPNLPVIEVVVVGDSRLVTHRFSEKAKKMILDKQMGKAASNAPRAPKNPDEEYEGAMYRTDDGQPGVPAVAFKAAMVAACRLTGKSLPMTVARIAFHVLGDILPIYGCEPKKRMDVVRLETGVVDLRFRPEFAAWWCRLKIKYVAGMLTAEQIVNLLNYAGLGGVCEWRPNSTKSFTGTWGMFHVASAEEIATLEGATRPARKKSGA